MTSTAVEVPATCKEIGTFRVWPVVSVIAVVVV